MCLVALVLCGILSSCNSVKANDLVGSWAVTEQSRKYIAVELTSVSPRITLNSDGTFIAVDLPRERRIGSQSPPFADVVISGRGTWKILALGGNDRVSLRFEDNSGGEFFISDWAMNGPWSSTTLYYFVGDPDEVRRIEFARQH